MSATDRSQTIVDMTATLVEHVRAVADGRGCGFQEAWRELVLGWPSDPMAYGRAQELLAQDDEE